MTEIGDLYPQVSLKWNRGLHNLMTYFTAVSERRLRPELAGTARSLGVDGGLGYTYANETSGTRAVGRPGFVYTS